MDYDPYTPYPHISVADDQVLMLRRLRITRGQTCTDQFITAWGQTCITGNDSSNGVHRMDRELYRRACEVFAPVLRTNDVDELYIGDVGNSSR